MSLPREGSCDTGEGIIVSTVPDVCLTPCGSNMVPVPYNITAKQSDSAANTTPTVRLTGRRSHNTGSLITSCHGDEAGTGGGVKSGTVGNQCEPLEHSASVRSEGKFMVRHNDLWWMNNKNTIGRLLWVKDSDRQALTPQSQQGWEALAGAGAGRVLSDASPANGGLFRAGNQLAFLDDGAAAAAEARAAAAEAEAAIAAARAAAATDLAAEEGVGAAATSETGVGGLVLGAAALATLGYAGYQTYAARKKLAEAKAEREKAVAAGRTGANVNVSSTEKDNEKRPCRTGRYGSLVCDPGEQAHHIVADYTLRYGNRAEGVAGVNRIPGLPSFNDGPAICLQGYAKTAGDEHNIAHEADAAIAALGGATGTAPINQITLISVASATKARPKCAAEIANAVAQRPSLLGNTAARTTIQLPGKWPP